MKTVKLLQIATIALLLFSAANCEKENPTALPPETQTGANTFGCYVNGKLFVAQSGYGYFGEPYLYGWYSKKDDCCLDIIANSKNGRLRLSAFKIEEETKNTLSVAQYKYWEKNIWYGGHMIDEIYITRFDTINKIVCGTFSCKLRIDDDQNNNTNDSIINIRDGRFDIKLDISQ
jgi:hypothetical protein